MNEEFREQHATTVRAIAEEADPFTKQRLLDLAASYDRPRRQRPPTPIASIPAEQAK